MLFLHKVRSFLQEADGLNMAHGEQRLLTFQLRTTALLMVAPYVFTSDISNIIMSFVFVNAGRSDLGFGRHATGPSSQPGEAPDRPGVCSQSPEVCRRNDVISIFFKRKEREEVHEKCAGSIC